MESSIASPDHTQYDILPLEINYIPEYIRLKANKEINVPIEERNSRLLELIKLLEGHKLSKGIVFQIDFLHRYLIHSRYDVNSAFSRIRSYLSLKKNHSYFFQSVKFDFTVLPSFKCVTMLPYRSLDGSIILLYEVGKWNPEEMPFEVIKQLSFIIPMQELRNPVTQLTGVHVIVDFKNAGLQQIKYCTPYNTYLMNHVSFEVLPIIYRGYHLVNGNAAMNTLLSLVKPFLPAFFRKILCIHSSPEELLDYFPSSILPSKYGGNLSEYFMADRLKNINEQHDDCPAEGQKNTFGFTFDGQ